MANRKAEKVALVTGAGSGIGLGAARALAREGVRVVLVGRTLKDLETLNEELTRENLDSIVVAADISDFSSMEHAVATVSEKWGRLDILVANAGVNGTWAPIEDLSIEDWSTTITINLTGTFNSIKACQPLLRRQGGAIIITSSVNGTRIFSNTGATAYSVSKAGQVALSRMLALEFAPQKIRINTICPGAIETEISDNTKKVHLEGVSHKVESPFGTIPLTHGKPGTIEQCGDLIAFLASDRASHITGAEIFIDGGQSLLQG